ncbi:MAG: hypothetical protein KJ592_00885 [Nanoarchaeota archaeon]|nr:hypothetical protein [Nanoarchaeota archaeon]
MSGIFGVVSKEDCIGDVSKGAFYLQNRAESYCGMAWKNSDDRLDSSPHKGLFRENFDNRKLEEISGNYAIGCVTGSREPVSEYSKNGEMLLCFDGNIANHDELLSGMLKRGASFSGYHNPEEVSDAVLISKMIAKESSFDKGIENLFNDVKGDFSIVALTRGGVYAARGWGRKPLILGGKDGAYAVSSESVSFINTGFDIFRDVKPGEVVYLGDGGIESVRQFDVDEIFGTFEWVYTAHPASVIDGRSVKLARNAIGGGLAKRYPVDADVVSPVPNSGRNHAEGYSAASGIPYNEVFAKFDYCGRSFTPNTLEEQNAVADEKLIPVRAVIEGNRIIVVDDSIVKGNQTRRQTGRLRENGAKEVHARIACPPLMAKCDYGKAIKQDEQCIARTMSLDEIRRTRGLDSLEYATFEDLESAIGKPLDKLCTDCWGR